MQMHDPQTITLTDADRQALRHAERAVRDATDAAAVAKAEYAVLESTGRLAIVRAMAAKHAVIRELADRYGFSEAAPFDFDDVAGTVAPKAARGAPTSGAA